MESTSSPPSKKAANLLAAIELMEFGIQLMRQNIARRLAGAPPERIEAELRRWLMEQPAQFAVGDTSRK